MASSPSVLKARQQLLAHRNQRGIRYDLESILNASAAIKNPHLNLPFSFHIAGTNGKGSVCHALTLALIQQGLRVGTYTSPHVNDYTERLCINLKPINNVFFEDLYNQIYYKTLEFKLTEFELLSLMAFKYFSQQNLDVVVIETGLGGRLDATNILKSNIAVITKIDLDHTHILGHSIEEISQEKAGIIKSKQQVFTSKNQNKTSKMLLKKHADKKEASFFESDVFEDPTLCDIENENLALAYEALKASPYSNTDKESFINCWKKKPLFGRFSKFSKGKQHIIIDGAHNPLGFETLAKQLQSNFSNHDVQVLLGLNSKRNPCDISAIVKLKPSKIYYCFFDEDLALPFKIIKESWPSLNIKPFKLGSKLPQCELLIITGSLYFIPNFYSLFQDNAN